MTSPDPAPARAAQRLILTAAKGHEDAAAVAAAAEHVFQALHDHLARLIGVIGFRALLARSLRMTRPALPSLAPIEVTAERTIDGRRRAVARERIKEGRVDVAYHVPRPLGHGYRSP